MQSNVHKYTHTHTHLEKGCFLNPNFLELSVVYCHFNIQERGFFLPAKYACACVLVHTNQIRVFLGSRDVCSHPFITAFAAFSCSLTCWLTARALRASVLIHCERGSMNLRTFIPLPGVNSIMLEKGGKNLKMVSSPCTNLTTFPSHTTLPFLYILENPSTQTCASEPRTRKCSNDTAR